MLEFDVEAFVAKMDRMGLKLTAVPLADGKYRLNRWRTMDAFAHTQQIQDLWASQVGDNQKRIDQLAAHLAQAAAAAPKRPSFVLSKARLTPSPARIFHEQNKGRVGDPA